jgi:hypothetical protein
MVMGLYTEMLLQALSQFNLDKAQEISFALGAAEAGGYVVTEEEDRLWALLCEKIMDEEFGP